MKKDFIQREVLLLTQSSFVQNQWCKKEDKNNNVFSPHENIEEACTNGLIQELLPEVFLKNNNKIYLWQMHFGFSFVQLEFGDAPLSFEKQSSLDPHNFLTTLILN